MADDETSAAKPQTKKINRAGVLRVRGPEGGRYRGDRGPFGPEETELPLASLTDEQIAAIEGDPLLSVTRTGG